MRYKELQEVVKHLQRFNRLKEIKRVDFNILKLIFENGYTIYFSIQKDNPTIFTTDSDISQNIPRAPIDTILQKRFSRSSVTFTLKPDDKILLMEARQDGAYKSETSILRVEFIPRQSNAIVLDSQNIVLEAIRHSGKNKSEREIVVGRGLEEPPPPSFSFGAIEEGFCLEEWLASNYAKKLEAKLLQKKSSMLKTVDEKKHKLLSLLESLEDEEELKRNSFLLKKQADALLANLDKVDLHKSSQELINYYGESVTIAVPSGAKSPSNAADMLFTKAKKYEKKAKNIYIQRDDIEAKIVFLDKLSENIKNAPTITELELLSQKQRRQKDRIKSPFETFYFESYKITVGRNQKENRLLLQYSKGDDLWFHIRDIPSCHVIVASEKKEFSMSVVEKAAKLCVDFSTDKKGDYEVDYTKRKFVKPKDGANVLYNKYKTISVRKE